MRQICPPVHGNIPHYAFKIANLDFACVRQEAIAPNHLRSSCLTTVFRTQLYQSVGVLILEQPCIFFPYTLGTWSIGNSFKSLFRWRDLSCDNHPIDTTHRYNRSDNALSWMPCASLVTIASYSSLMSPFTITSFVAIPHLSFTFHT